MYALGRFRFGLFGSWRRSTSIRPIFSSRFVDRSTVSRDRPMHSASRARVGMSLPSGSGSVSRSSGSTKDARAAYKALSTGSTDPSRARSASNFTQSQAADRTTRGRYGSEPGEPFAG